MQQKERDRTTDAEQLELDAKRAAREARLIALGFEPVDSEQRRKNLALNIALRAWPK